MDDTSVENIVNFLKSEEHNEKLKDSIFLDFLNTDNTLTLFLKEIDEDILKYVLKNIKNITNSNSLLILYVYFAQQQNFNVCKEISTLFLTNLEIKNDDISYFHYDHLFIFSIGEKIDFSTLTHYICSNQSSNNFIKFLNNPKNILENKKSNFNDGIKSSLLFDINIMDFSKKHIIDYLFLRESTSSGMENLSENKDYLLEILDLNNLEFEELNKYFDHERSYKLFDKERFKIEKTSDSLDDIINNTDEVIKELENIVYDIKLIKSLSVKNKSTILQLNSKKFNSNIFKLVKTDKKYNSYGDIEEDKDDNKHLRLNFERNKKLTLEQKLILLNKSIKYIQNKPFAMLEIITPLYDVLSEVKEYSQLKDYENIKFIMNKFYYEQFLNFHYAKNNLGYSRTDINEINIICLIENFKGDEFLSSLFDFIMNNDDKNTIPKTLNTSIELFDKERFFKIFSKHFTLKSFMKIAKIQNESYFYQLYKDYSSLFRNVKLNNFILDILIEKNEIKEIVQFKNFFYDFDKEKLNQFILDNSEEVRKNGFEEKYYDLFFENKIIDEEKFKDILRKKLYHDFNHKQYEKIFLLKEPENFIDSLNIDLQFKLRIMFFDQTENFYSNYDINSDNPIISLKENNKVFDILKENKFELLTNEDIIEDIVKGNEYDNNLLFLENMNDYFKSIELTSEIFEIAEYLDISINKNIKEKFYHMFVKDVEEVFSI